MSTVAEKTPVRAVARTEELPVYAYEPWRHGVLPRMREAWYHRNLMGHTAFQFVIKRYRKTYLGWLWIFLRPGIQIITTTFFFGGVLGVGYGDRPAMVYLSITGAAWVLFERSFHWGMRSVRMTRALSKGLHMPRSLASVTAGAPAVLDFVIHSALAVGIVLYYSFALDNPYFAPAGQWPIGFAGLGMLLAFGLAIGLFTGPLMDLTKEVRYLQVYVLQFWMMITPVLYPTPKQFETLVELNPLTGPVQMVTWGFLSTSSPGMVSTISSVVCLAALVVGGFIFSSRFERAAVARL